jgi:hypothetical protein
MLWQQLPFEADAFAVVLVLMGLFVAAE